MRLRILFPVLILLIFVVLLVNGALELSADAMLFPWIVGGLASILLPWEIVKEIKRADRKTHPDADPETRPAGIKEFMGGMGWLVAVLPMTYLFGLTLTIPLYLFAYMKLHGEGYLISIVLSLLAGAFFYFVFVVLLKFPFYDGLLFLYLQPST